MRKGFLILVLCLVAPLTRAHPHVFVDVGLQLRPYDPLCCAALELAGTVRLPEGCTGKIAEPGRARTEEKPDSLGGAGDEALFEEVRVGIFFAYTLEVTCVPRY